MKCVSVVDSVERWIGRGPAGWLFGLAVMVLGVCTPVVHGQSTITATASFDEQVCYLGDQIRLVISVENADAIEPPDLSGLPGATFDFLGTGRESGVTRFEVNGRTREVRTNRHVSRWTVTPTETGTLIVPPMLVKVDGGQVVETNEVRVRVLEPERETREVLVARVDTDRLYVNQPVRVRVSWMFDSQIEAFSFLPSRADDGLRIQPLEKPRRNNQRRFTIKIFGGEGIADLGYDTLEGRRVQALQFDLMVTPTRPGKLDLGPLVVTYDEAIDRRSTRKVIAESEPITFDVLPMPTDGRPENFSGLLGTHGIATDAEPTSVSVGDPIALEVTIIGPEPMAGVQDGPDLEDIPAFADGFRLASEGWTFRPGSTPGERTFTTTIRVADPSVTEIPSIPLWFFDPEEGVYRKAESEAIPLDVRAVREITAADAVVAASGPVAVSRDPLSATDAGVWAIERGPAVLAQGDPLAGAFWREPGFVAVASAPPAVCALAGLLAVRRRKSRDAAALRRARALREAKRVLARDGAAHAVRRYLGDLFNASPEAITGADAARLLKDAGLSGADAKAVVGVIEADESAGFGRAGSGWSGAGTTGSDLSPSDVSALLDRVHRQLRQGDRSVTVHTDSASPFTESSLRTEVA